MIDVGRCVANVLAEAERLAGVDPAVASIVFPLLGVGTGGGDVASTVHAMLNSVIDHLRQRRRDSANEGIRTVLFLAHTEAEWATCRSIFNANAILRQDFLTQPVRNESASAD